MMSKLPLDELDEGSPRALIGLAAASTSGFTVGILMRGALFVAVGVIVVAIVFPFPGWLAKGMTP